MQSNIPPLFLQAPILIYTKSVSKQWYTFKSTVALYLKWMKFLLMFLIHFLLFYIELFYVHLRMMELCIQERVKEKHKQELQALQVNNMGYYQFCVLEYRCIVEVNNNCFLKGVYISSSWNCWQMTTHCIVVSTRGNEGETWQRTSFIWGKQQTVPLSVYSCLIKNFALCT